MKVLLVDDDNDVRGVVQEALAIQGLEVVPVSSVKDALQQIVMQNFDVLLTDLHMPGAGDGFTVVTAMRHLQPSALTVILSGFPDVERAMDTISVQADHVLAKPIGIRQLSQVILGSPKTQKRTAICTKEPVANILESDSAATIQNWLLRVEHEPELVAIPLTFQERTSYVPEILKNIVTRLRKIRDIEAVALPSPAAVAHGALRHRQGYTAPLIVQESRILQVSIFETIQRNLTSVDFSLVLPDVMLIADEVDSQLSQSVDSFLRINAQQS
jgi:DNA-binding response OmpR family regulator